MKKTQVIDLFKNVKSSIVSFVAIVIFVTLAVAVYLGLGWSGDGFSMSIAKE